MHGHVAAVDNRYCRGRSRPSLDPRLLAQIGAAPIDLIYLGDVRARCLGLPGCPAAIELQPIAVAFAGNDVLFQSIFVLRSAVGGLIVMNMRFPRQRRARAFLDDSGIGVIGLAIAWVSLESRTRQAFL